jgi:hypothetical protein
MRIISQDGCYDIPYESIILQRLGTTIFGVTTGLQESVTIARYRKEEKAMKAMEMCREQYAQSELNKDMIQKVADTLSKMSVSVIDDVRKQLSEKYLFQFPADDEI